MISEIIKSTPDKKELRKFAITIFSALGIIGTILLWQKKDIGFISLSGPLTNIVVAVLFLMVSVFGGIWGILGSTGFFVNLWLAAFNLIPFGMMDGQKIFSWNPIIWALVSIPVWIITFLR